MSFESTTLGLLTGNAALTALVPSTSINFGISPQSLQFPVVLCFPVSMEAQLTTDNGQTGVGRLDNIRLQVSCYARTYSAARSIADAVRVALEGQLQANVTKYLCVDYRSAQEDIPDCFGIVLQFSCWHPST